MEARRAKLPPWHALWLSGGGSGYSRRQRRTIDAALALRLRALRRSMMEIATTWTPAAYDRTAAHWHLTPSEVSGGSILSRPPQPAPPAVLS